MKDTQQRVSVLKYVGIFLLIWIVSTFLVGTGAKYLSLPGIVLGALLFFALLGACCFVGNKFIKDHDRLPTAPERKRLFWYSFILPALFNILGIVAIYMADLPETEALRNAPVILNAATTIVTFVIAIVLPMYIGYGWALNKMFDRYQAKKS